MSSRSHYQGKCEDVLHMPINSSEELITRIHHIDTIESELNRTYAWTYIHQTIDTNNPEHQQAYESFINEIYPSRTKRSHECHTKLIISPSLDELPDTYQVYIQSIRHSIQLFREENIALFAQEKQLASQRSTITGSWTIVYKDTELTLQQANDYLSHPDRQVRKEVFELIEQRRYRDKEILDELMDKLITIRTQIAHNCGFPTYTDYKLSRRFDYTQDDMMGFHEAIQQVITPLLQQLFEERKNILGLDSLAPYDFDVALSPSESHLFIDTDQMIDSLCTLLHDMNPSYVDCIRHMQSQGYLDLETRPHKAPGGYNYPLSGTPYSFIFMNALRDGNGRFTRAHEAGHALHHYLNRHISPDFLRDCPSEICEIASMAMELFTIDSLDHIGLSPAQIHTTLYDKILKDIAFLPYMSKIDLFQQWMYNHPHHTRAERNQERKRLQILYPYSMRTRSHESRGEGYTDYLDTFWQRQMHLFEVPFYYIEYGIAYMAALQLYGQWRDNPSQAIKNYNAILSDGYRRSIPETMKLGQIDFALDTDTMQGLITNLLNKLN